MKHIEELYDLCEVIEREIADANEKIRKAGGTLTAGDVDYIDKLTHTLKSIKATIAMIEDEDEYSSRGSYEGGMSYRSGRDVQGGSSYARGRRGNVRRDSMGRYSSERGYSRDMDEMSEKLRELMEDAPNEQIKRDIERLMEKVERM